MINLLITATNKPAPTGSIMAGINLATENYSLSDMLPSSFFQPTALTVDAVKFWLVGDNRVYRIGSPKGVYGCLFLQSYLEQRPGPMHSYTW